MSLFVRVCWYREGSGGKGHTRGSHPVCVCVCVCVTLASLPELKEPAPDSEHTDTTQYCAGIECYGEKLSLEDWRWEINELQLKEGTRKKRRRFWAGDKEAEVRMYKWEVGNSKTWDKNKVIPRTNLDLACSKVLVTWWNHPTNIFNIQGPKQLLETTIIAKC